MKFTCGRAGGVILWILVVGEARLGKEGGSTNGGIKPGGRNDESLGTRILTTAKYASFENLLNNPPVFLLVYIIYFAVRDFTSACF